MPGKPPVLALMKPKSKAKAPAGKSTAAPKPSTKGPASAADDAASPDPESRQSQQRSCTPEGRASSTSPSQSQPQSLEGTATGLELTSTSDSGVQEPTSASTPTSRQASTGGTALSKQTATPVSTPSKGASHVDPSTTSTIHTPSTSSTAAPPSVHQLMHRMKATGRDAVSHISTGGNPKDADDFIAVLEEQLRAVKTAKMEAKSALRKPPTSATKESRPSSVISPQPATVPQPTELKSSEEPNTTSGKSTTTATTAATTASAPSAGKSWAAMARPTSNASGAEEQAVAPGGASSATASADAAAENEELQKQRLAEKERKRKEKEAEQERLKAEKEAEKHRREEAEKKRREERAIKLREEKLAEEKRLAEKERKEEERKVRQERERAAKEEAARIAQAAALTEQEEQQRVTHKFNRSIATVRRTASLYLEQYHEAAPRGHKELNKSKLRGILQRLQNSPDSRSALREMCAHFDEAYKAAGSSLAAVDQEFLRYNNGYETLAMKAAEATQGAKDANVLSRCCDLLRRLLTDPQQGDQNITFFLQSAGFVPFLQIIFEAIRSAKRTVITFSIGVSMSILQLCLPKLLDPASKLTSIKDAVSDLLSNTGAFQFILSATSAAAGRQSDYSGALVGLGLLSHMLPFVGRRMNPVEKTEFTDSMVSALFRLLSGILTHEGSPLPENTNLSPTACSLVFIAFRLLNTIARHDIPAFQTLVTPPAAAGAATAASDLDGNTSMANNSFSPMMQTLSGFLAYVNSHERQEGGFDMAPTFAQHANIKGVSSNFKDCLRYGLTEGLPLPPELLPGPDGCDSNPKTVQTTPRALPSPTSGGGSNDNCRHLRAALHEMFLLIGYVAVLNEPVQTAFGEMPATGGKSLAERLVADLPCDYFTSAKHVFFPTLIAICYNQPKIKSKLSNSMKVASLSEFVAEEMSLTKAKSEKKVSPPPQEVEELEITSPTAAGAGATAGSGRQDSARTISTHKSWAEMMDDEDDGVAWEDPLERLSNSPSTIGSWQHARSNTNRSANSADGEDMPPATMLPAPLQALRGGAGTTRDTAAPVDPKELRRREHLRQVTKGPVPPGLPTMYAHFRMPRRLPVDMWSGAKTFFQ